MFSGVKIQGGRYIIQAFFPSCFSPCKQSREAIFLKMSDKTEQLLFPKLGPHEMRLLLFALLTSATHFYSLYHPMHSLDYAANKVVTAKILPSIWLSWEYQLKQHEKKNLFIYTTAYEGHNNFTMGKLKDTNLYKKNQYLCQRFFIIF